MGVDKMHASRTTEAQKLDTRQVAKAWRCQNLQATVDKIMRAAEKLEEELAAEAVYWEQVRTVSDKGWAVCRLPGERHTMAVRLGFFEGMLVYAITVARTDALQLPRHSEIAVLRLYAESMTAVFILTKELSATNRTVSASALRWMV